MSLNSRECSVCDGEPFEGYWFTCGPNSWRFTNGDTDRVINGFLYERETILRDEIDQNQEARAGSIKVQIPLDNPVAEIFKGLISPRPVSLVVFHGQVGETEVGAYFTGMVASVKRQNTCELTCVTENDTMKQDVPGLHYQVQCPRDLFSDGCTLRRQDWEVLGTISDVNGNLVSSPAFAAKPDGWFAGGWLEWNGTAMAIVAHVGQDLTLFFPLEGLASNANVVAYPGCQGTEAVCAEKFSNLVNHLGFARIPSKNPFGEGGIA